jgi:hypothetical protein
LADVGTVKANAAANNGMHPTVDTLLVIFSYLLGRRVMPGVRCSLKVKSQFDQV